MARAPIPADGPSPERRQSDFFYIRVCLGMVGVGAGFFALSLVFRHSLGFVLMHTVGVALIAVGIAVLLYRVLDQQNVASLFKFGGTAATATGIFGLIFWIEDRSFDLFKKVQDYDKPPATAGAAAAAPAAPIPPPQATQAAAQTSQAPVIIHVPNIDKVLQQKGFATNEMLLQLITPFMSDLQKSKVTAQYASFASYPPLVHEDKIRGQVWPRPVNSDKSDDFYSQYAVEFCAMPDGPDWSRVSQIVLNCSFGAGCSPDPMTKAIKACPKPQAAAWLRPIAALLAPQAHAATPLPKSGWVVPDIEGACFAHARFGQTFYRFDAQTAAPPRAVAFGYQLSVNGTPIYINGQRDPRVRKPVSGGSATLSFALQNLEFSGAAGPIGGQEKIGLALQFYDAAGNEVGRKAGDYLFVALRQPKPLAGDISWTGKYVLGKDADGRELLIVSTGTPTANMLPVKRQFDALGMTYAGTGDQLNGRLPVVALVRPFLPKEEKAEKNARDGMPGMNLGFVKPDGRVRFTFSEAELKQVAAWYNAERLKYPLTRGWQDAYPYAMRKTGTVSPAQAGCPTA